MTWQYLAAAIAASVLASALVSALFASRVRRELDALRAEHAAAGQPDQTHADRFADIAEQLVNLARNAAESAIRNAEVEEWHRPNLTGTEDDVSEAARNKLRRAATSAAAARALLAEAIRRNRTALPDALAIDLEGFCDRLAGDDDEPSGARRRRLSADLDQLESRFRDRLGRDLSVDGMT